MLLAPYCPDIVRILCFDALLHFISSVATALEVPATFLSKSLIFRKISSDLSNSENPLFSGRASASSSAPTPLLVILQGTERYTRSTEVTSVSVVPTGFSMSIAWLKSS